MRIQLGESSRGSQLRSPRAHGARLGPQDTVLAEIKSGDFPTRMPSILRG